MLDIKGPSSVLQVALDTGIEVKQSRFWLYCIS